jgi:hypothetical protein
MSDDKIPWNFLKGCWKEKGALPAQYKKYEAHFKNDSAVLASMTPAQRKAAEDAIRSLPAAGSNPGASYVGADYMALVEAYRDRRKCSLFDAMAAVNATEAGKQARIQYLKARNPHVESFGE